MIFITYFFVLPIQNVGICPIYKSVFVEIIKPIFLQNETICKLRKKFKMRNSLFQTFDSLSTLSFL